MLSQTNACWVQAIGCGGARRDERYGRTQQNRCEMRCEVELVEHETTEPGALCAGESAAGRTDLTSPSQQRLQRRTQRRPYSGVEDLYNFSMDLPRSRGRNASQYCSGESDPDRLIQELIRPCPSGCEPGAYGKKWCPASWSRVKLCSCGCTLLSYPCIKVNVSKQMYQKQKLLAPLKSLTEFLPSHPPSSRPPASCPPASCPCHLPLP